MRCPGLRSRNTPVSLIYVIAITGWCHRYKSMERRRRPLSKQTQPPPQMSSPSHIPASGPNDSILTYPPTARVMVDKQPTAKTEMSPRPGQETGVERLRGGCIPCPVRSIPSVAHCNFLTTILTGRRMLLLYPHPLLLTACNPLPPSELRTLIWTMDTMITVL